MLKLKLQYFGHLMRRAISFEKNLMLGKIEGKRNNRWRDGWMASPTQWTWVWASFRVGDGQGSLACCNPRGHKGLDMTKWLNWTEDIESHKNNNYALGQCFQYLDRHQYWLSYSTFGCWLLPKTSLEIYVPFYDSKVKPFLNTELWKELWLVEYIDTCIYYYLSQIQLKWQK